MSIGIYKVTNTINGMFYVGKSNNIERRFSQHLEGYQSATLLKRAINKYGPENFVLDILEECDEKDLNEREKYWISKLDARNRSVGYNIHPGGDGGDVCSAMPPEMYEEFCKKVSEGVTGRTWTDHQREVMSEKMSGKGNPMYGKHSSEKQKKAVSEAAKRRKGNFSDEQRQSIRDNNSKAFTGRKWMKKDGVEKSKFVAPEECDRLLADGWVFGMKRNKKLKK